MRLSLAVKYHAHQPFTSIATAAFFDCASGRAEMDILADTDEADAFFKAHKNLLYELYITERQSLKRVREAMFAKSIGTPVPFVSPSIMHIVFG